VKHLTNHQILYVCLSNACSFDFTVNFAMVTLKFVIGCSIELTLKLLPLPSWGKPIFRCSPCSWNPVSIWKKLRLVS